MSVKATTYVWDHSPYGGGQRLIHLAIADVVNDGNEWLFWASLPSLAAKAAVTDRTVRTAVGQMVADGYLELVEERSGKPTIYRFLRPTPENSSGVRNTTPEISDSEPRKSDASAPIVNERGTRQSGSGPKVTKPRPRDPLFDALADEEGIGKDETGKYTLTRNEGTRIAVAAKQLKEIGTTAGDVHLRARRYRERHASWDFTANALVTHWSALGTILKRDRRDASWPSR